MPDVPAALAEPGLKVPATAWKWPRSWPFGLDGFVRDAEAPAEPAQAAIFDAGAAEALAQHYVRHVKSDCESVLEIDGTGAGVSYLPEDGGEELWFPPDSVTRVDASRLEKQELLSELADQSFDVVLLNNGAELLLEPRRAFREIYRLLKPGGRAIIAFSSARCSDATHSARISKMWRDYNDAQRLWVVGSYFHFAGGAPAAAMAAEMGVDVGTEDDVYGAGWRGLRAYDYFENAEEKESGLFSGKTADAVGADGKPVTPLFVVQADRALDVLPGAGLVARVDFALRGVEHMEEDDKRLCASRLLQLVEREIAAGLAPEQAELLAFNAASQLSSLYAILKPMATVIATPLLAQLAANVAPKWSADSPAQAAALREGLGLDTPRDVFWKPLGDATASLSIDDKLWLLSDVLPLFAESTPRGEDGVPVALRALVDLALPSASAAVAAQAGAPAMPPNKPLPVLEPNDAQLLALDLVCRDFLPDAATAVDAADALAKASRFAAWCETLDGETLVDALTERKSYVTLAQKEGAADQGDVDPAVAKELAAKAKRAAAVETMLNDIMKNVDAKAKA